MIEETIREVVREAVREALAGGEWTRPATPPEDDGGWRSRVHRVHPDTRLSLAEVAEALACSERTVRRYLAGEGSHDPLPHRRGPTGTTVAAGDLLRWITDVEEGERWKEARR